MPTDAVAHYLYLLDGAFETAPWHSLLGNLRSVTPDDWALGAPRWAALDPGDRTPVAGAKRMYHNQAFGDGRMTWTDPLLEDPTPCATLNSAIAWLREGQALIRSGVAALDDAGSPRPAPVAAGQNAGDALDYHRHAPA